ncbi:MAG: pyridoxal phosphate-dependent aminotransferase [Firmicutes bacterium]|nr:pyridoxal phosphate-dependent aminotransferase [Bacillota bacterium]
MQIDARMYRLGSARNVIRETYEYGKSRAEIVGRENIYDFSIGNPAVPPPETLNRTMEEILENEPPIDVHGYTSAQGDAAVRQAIADELNGRFGTHFHKDNFYLTCGATAAIAISLGAILVPECNEVIGIAPYFPEYGVFTENSGGKFVVVPPDTVNFQIDFKALEEAINPRTRAVIINSPNNPAGIVYSEETIKTLAALLERKSAEYGNAIVLISDEPYREIVYDGLQIPFVTKYYRNTIVCYSFSKSLSIPGERFGYALVPDEMEDSESVYLAVCGAGRSMGYICAPSILQRTLGKIVGAVSDISEYKKNRDLLYGGLTKIGYTCVMPQGAFYLFVKALEEDSAAFCRRCKDLDILVVDGAGFGCPGYVRLAYCVTPEMIERSMAAFQKLYDSYQ